MCALGVGVGVVGFIRPAIVVVGFIRVVWVHSCAPRWSLGSFGRAFGSFGCAVVCLIPARPGGYPGHSFSLGSLGRALGVDGFILVRCVHLGALVVVWFIRFRWVHSGVSWVSLRSFGCALGAVAFILARPGCRRVYSCS